MEAKKIERKARIHSGNVNSFVVGSQCFKNSLWHNGSERPKRHAMYFIKFSNGYVGLASFDDDGWNIPSKYDKVAMWLDLK